MSGEVPHLEPGQVAVADLRVVGDDVEKDFPILRQPYALRMLHSLYDHAASKVECPMSRTMYGQLKPDARQAMDGLVAAELVVWHPPHDARVSQAGITQVTRTIALTERGRAVVEAHSKRKIAMSTLDVVDERDVLS